MAPPVVGGTTGTTAPPTPATPPATTAGATIVPLYTSPGDPSWTAVIAAKKAHPTVGVVAIVNPSNGPGGAVSSAYASGIAGLNAAGIKVLGYVATGYTANSAASVKADIDRWKAFYPGQIGGIFFDEQSNKAGDVAYYRDLSQYTKAQGLSFTVGNPGTDTAESFVGALDMMLIYESAGLPAESRLAWMAREPRALELRHHPVRDAAGRDVRPQRPPLRAVHLPAERQPAQPVGQRARLLQRSAGRARVGDRPSGPLTCTFARSDYEQVGAGGAFGPLLMAMRPISTPLASKTNWTCCADCASGMQT